MFKKSNPTWADVEAEVMKIVEALNDRHTAIIKRLETLEKEPRIINNYTYPQSPTPVWAPSPVVPSPYWTCSVRASKETNS